MSRVSNAKWKAMTVEQQNSVIKFRKQGKKPKQKKKAVVKSTKKSNRKGVPRERKVVTQIAIHPAIMPNQDRRVQITADFSTEAYRNMFIALASYCAQKNVINIDDNDHPMQWASIYDALTYLMITGAEDFIGSTITVGKLPRVLDNVFQALSPTEINYGLGKVAYGFKQFITALQGLDIMHISIYGKNWWSSFVDSDGSTQAEPAGVYTGQNNSDRYNAFLSIINSLDANGMLDVVTFGESNLFLTDPSAFARVYNYFGNNSGIGGSWLDCELELARLLHPFFAKFVPYNPDPSATDARLARALIPYSLDSLSVTGMPLHNCFDSYSNANPPRIMQIDLDEVFTIASLWMAKLKYAAAKAGQFEALNPLPMTQQTMYLVFRSMMMVLFDSQYFVQFLGDNGFIGTNSNCFIPFFVMAHCAGDVTFGRLNLPSILVENLCALKARTVGPVGSKHKQTYIPVVGRWYLNTLPTINIVDADNNVLGPLYTAATVPPEVPIDFIDCSASVGSPPVVQPINVQGDYYQTALDDWNLAVNDLKIYSATVQESTSDAGAKGLLAATSIRIIDNLDSESRTKKMERAQCKLKHSKSQSKLPTRVCQSLLFCENKPFDLKVVKGRSIVSPKEKVKDKEKVDKPRDLPPATILNQATKSVISAVPIEQEMWELLDIIILPKDWLDPTNDVLTKSMLQVAAKLPFSYVQLAHGNNAANTGAGEWARMEQYANELIAGYARDAPTKFQQSFNQLIRDGGAGALTQMLASVVGTIFPGASGVANTIAAALPF